jgi:hypothetical protein
LISPISFAASEKLSHTGRVHEADDIPGEQMAPLNRGAVALVLAALFFPA